MSGSAERDRWVAGWWRGEKGFAGDVLHAALWPAELLYRGVTRARNRLYDSGLLRSHAGAIPVIGVGNLAVGGTGKTPVTAWLVRQLKRRGMSPAIVLRGYGRDEVEVHRELNPGVQVVVEPDRVAGVQQASAAGADVVVLDDAFQHRRIRRDLDIVLVAAESWTDKQRLLPRGPWRESVDALKRADFVGVTRKTASTETAARLADRLASQSGLPAAVLNLEPMGFSDLHGEVHRPRPLEEVEGANLLAVATLADPRPFIDQLTSAGATVELVSFPDHHEFTPSEAEALLRRAGERLLVMTRKEAVKLRELLPTSREAWVLEQEVVVVQGREALEMAVGEAIRSGGS